MDKPLHKYDYDSIAESYKSGDTLKLAAKKNGCSVGAVRHALKVLGIKTRERSYRMTEVDRVIRSKRVKPSKIRVADPSPPPRKDYPNRNELLKIAKTSCKALGGFAEIGEGFFIVDSNRFEISDKR